MGGAVKQFILGWAMLMFISSLPADATNNHPIRLEPDFAITTGTVLQSFGDTLPPIGYVTFCRDHEAECRPATKLTDRVQLSAQKRIELEQVNKSVNDAVSPVTDLDLYGQVEMWAYPSAQKGDCEDYVLQKRRLLVERGWPESTLLITVVRDENNEGHAVLTVRTDRGDLVLDNKRREILAWNATPYTFIKQQSERNPLVWISLLAPDQATPAAVATSRSN